MGSIYLIRHGQASFGAEDYDNLSELGSKQSHMLGQHFSNIGLNFDKVYTGAMRRHQQTADACLQAMALKDGKLQSAETTTLNDFNEYDHEQVFQVFRPEFKDKTKLTKFLASQANPQKAFHTLFTQAVDRWASGQFDNEYTETWSEFKARCKRGLDTTSKNADPSQQIAVFTSGGPISSNIQQHLNIPDTHIQTINWSMVNCSITHFLYNSKGVSLSYYNNYSHLESSINSPFITYR